MKFNGNWLRSWHIYILLLPIDPFLIVIITHNKK